MVQWRKLGMAHQDSLAKIILQGTVEGKQSRGRPVKSWLDTIKDWTKQLTARLLCTVEDWQRWHVMAAKAATVSLQRVSLYATNYTTISGMQEIYVQMVYIICNISFFIKD